MGMQIDPATTPFNWLLGEHGLLAIWIGKDLFKIVMAKIKNNGSVAKIQAKAEIRYTNKIIKDVLKRLTKVERQRDDCSESLGEMKSDYRNLSNDYYAFKAKHQNCILPIKKSVRG